MNTCTKHTSSFAYWRHETQLEAMRRGGSLQQVVAASGRLRAYYDAGAPVWLAAQRLRDFSECRQVTAFHDASPTRRFTRRVASAGA